jgi:hypothetical protein
MNKLNSAVARSIQFARGVKWIRFTFLKSQKFWSINEIIIIIIIITAI